ncbi:MAG: thioredoxin-disulfide reductase [Propionibacteriaceae bacterium]|jgi:thioredoxin reductase (NADPH)|nr:thioredoxin-disulfide reductase [Propionibacteriaceae bacterium]
MTREVIIVGSGPAGYTAGIYAARAGLQPLLFEGSVSAGGALMNTTDIENFPGFPEGIAGPELMLAMREQAKRFGTEIVTEDVIELRLDADPKLVVDGAEREYAAKAIILAMGSAYRQLGLVDESRLTGRGVSYCATCDGFFFRGKEIAVVGGGDTAIEEATFLTRFAAKVTVIHRRDELRASQTMIDRAMADEKLEFAWNSVVTELHGDPALTSVTLTDTVTGAKRLLDVQGLFVAIGHEPRNQLVAGKVELTEGGYVKVAAPGTATNIPGVFAAGDLTDWTYRQAITAAASGCRAAKDVEKYLG